MRLVSIYLCTASAVTGLVHLDATSQALVRRVVEGGKVPQQLMKGYPEDFKKQHPDLKIGADDPDYPYVDGLPVPRDVEPEWAKRNAEALHEAQKLGRIHVHDCWMRYVRMDQRHPRTSTHQADKSGTSDQVSKNALGRGGD